MPPDSKDDKHSKHIACEGANMASMTLSLMMRFEEKVAVAPNKISIRDLDGVQHIDQATKWNTVSLTTDRQKCDDG